MLLDIRDLPAGLIGLVLSLMNTRRARTTVWAHGLVPAHSDPSAGVAPAVEDYDYDGNYDYDANPKAGSTNSTRYRFFCTKEARFRSRSLFVRDTERGHCASFVLACHRAA